jgi:hypothetical protein
MNDSKDKILITYKIMCRLNFLNLVGWGETESTWYVGY